VAAEHIRQLELRVEQLELQVEQLEDLVTRMRREVADAHRRTAETVAVEHEQASRHVEAARWERDTAVRQLEEFERTSTYRLVTLVHRVFARGRGPSR
jgi:predicted RNase H-like nuclease (RuvC/YqgF family)